MSSTTAGSPAAEGPQWEPSVALNAAITVEFDGQDCALALDDSAREFPLIADDGLIALLGIDACEYPGDDEDNHIDEGLMLVGPDREPELLSIVDGETIEDGPPCATLSRHGGLRRANRRLAKQRWSPMTLLEHDTLSQRAQAQCVRGTELDLCATDHGFALRGGDSQWIGAELYVHPERCIAVVVTDGEDSGSACWQTGVEVFRAAPLVPHLPTEFGMHCS